MKSKNELRKEIKKKVQTLSILERRNMGNIALSKLEMNKLFQNAQTILSFWSLPDEIFTHNFNEIWCERKQILLPVVVGDKLELRQFEGVEKMQKGAFGIMEPQGEAFTDFDSIDLAIIPGVGFSPQGARLGRGKGYYDRLLPNLHCPKIGLALPCQIADEIPTDEWDIPMDEVIFGNGIL
jgi:5-formyltetrahydrofolate cyclo-ligase